MQQNHYSLCFVCFHAQGVCQCMSMLHDCILSAWSDYLWKLFLGKPVMIPLSIVYFYQKCHKMWTKMTWCMPYIFNLSLTVPVSNKTYLSHNLWKPSWKTESPSRARMAHRATPISVFINLGHVCWKQSSLQLRVHMKKLPASVQTIVYVPR